MLHHIPVQVPLWRAALDGHPDWQAIYAGYESAVDWPTAGFVRELHEAYPSSKFILTVRDPQRWANSFSQTIYTLIGDPGEMPPEMADWIAMGTSVMRFPLGLDHAGLMKAFEAHREMVKAIIPAEQLLEFKVKNGWAPLCGFLDRPAPDEPFPRTNDRKELWDLVSGKGCLAGYQVSWCFGCPLDVLPNKWFR